MPEASEGADPRSGMGPAASENDPFADDAFHRQTEAEPADAAKSEEAEPAEKVEPGIDPAAVDAAKEIRAELAKAFGQGEKIAEGITVTGELPEMAAKMMQEMTLKVSSPVCKTFKPK